ncbi:MAG: glycosyl transferase [Microbacterium sp.]
MRFVWAAAAFVLAAVMIGAGIAQRTVFEGPTSVSAAIEITGDAPYVLIDGAVLTSHDGSQLLSIEQDGEIFAAYGRTADVEAWLAKSDYTRVTLEDGEIVSSAVAATDPPAADADPIAPAGSDLWLAEFSEQDLLSTRLQLPAEMSVLIATDGIAAAPASISLTWPLHYSTPWAGPLILGGAVLLVVGIVLYVLGVRHVRRSRGPRRKGLPMPATEPVDLAVEAGDKGVISAMPTRRQLSRGRRALVAAPVVVSAMLVSGCSADAWPDLAPIATPSATATVVVPDDQGSPVVTQAQAQAIVGRIAETVASADEAMDATAAATRLDGTALAVRETNYTLRAAVADQPALTAIPDGELDLVLPEANDAWPRTFLAVAAGDSADMVMSITQEDPWSPYKLTDVAQLTSDTTLQLAPTYVGAIPILADSPFLALAPDQLAAAYADVLTNGDASEFASLFDTANDAFLKTLDADRADRVASFNQTGSETGSISFSAEAADVAPVALATLDSGAIVVVTVYDRDTVTPTNEDAVIKLNGDPANPVVQTLAGVDESSTGFTTTYADQLFFFVPSQSSNQLISLLGFSSDVLDAKEVE